MLSELITGICRLSMIKGRDLRLREFSLLWLESCVFVCVYLLRSGFNHFDLGSLPLVLSVGN